MSNFHLILFYSEKHHIATYGYIINWNNTGYLEVYHSERTYRVKDLPNILFNISHTFHFIISLTQSTYLRGCCLSELRTGVGFCDGGEDSS